MHIMKWLVPSRKKKEEALWAYWADDDHETGRLARTRGRRGWKSRDELARHYVSHHDSRLLCSVSSLMLLPQ